MRYMLILLGLLSLVPAAPTDALGQAFRCRPDGPGVRCERDWFDPMDLLRRPAPRPTPSDAFWDAFDRQRLLNAELERLRQEAEWLRIQRRRLEREQERDEAGRMFSPR